MSDGFCLSADKMEMSQDSIWSAVLFSTQWNTGSNSWVDSVIHHNWLTKFVSWGRLCNLFGDTKFLFSSCWRTKIWTKNRESCCHPCTKLESSRLLTQDLVRHVQNQSETEIPDSCGQWFSWWMKVFDTATSVKMPTVESNICHFPPSTSFVRSGVLWNHFSCLSSCGLLQPGCCFEKSRYDN